MLVVSVLYCKFTQDCPQGNYTGPPRAGVEIEGGKKGGWAVFKAAMKNYRVWMLFVTYGACFGVELFVHNVAASYYVDRFRARPRSQRAWPRAASACWRSSRAPSAASSRIASHAKSGPGRAHSPSLRC